MISCKYPPLKQFHLPKCLHTWPVICFFIFSHYTSIAQTSKHWVGFTDKNNSPFSLDKPQEFLSERAIERRKKFNIALDSTDLPVNPAYLQAIRNAGGTVLHTSKWFNGATIEVDNFASFLQITRLPFVKEDREVGKKAFDYDREPKEPRIRNVSKRNYEPSDYGLAFDQIAIHNGHLLHNAGFTGKGMLVAVFDAGFSRVKDMFVFDSLFIENRIGPNRDFVLPTNDDVYNFDSHGTLVLSCMAANAPKQMIGTAPHAHYILVRTENNMNGSELIIEEENWIAGAEYADSLGVDVINSSLGYSTFDKPEYNHRPLDMDGNTTRITQGADMAAKKGILVVNSAGNSGSNPWRVITAPADGDSVLAVGAISRPIDGQPFVRTGFSSQGLLGINIQGRVKPNVMAVGGQTTVAGLNNNITTSNGTSFSAPIMAGLASCLWQALPHKNNFEIIKILEAFGHNASNPDSLMGYGVPNVYAAYLKNRLPDFSNQNQKVWLYPNPKLPGDPVFLWFKSEKENTLIEVYDIQGKIIMQQQHLVQFEGIQNIQLNLPQSMQNGVYIIKLHTKTQTYQTKLVYQN